MRACPAGLERGTRRGLESGPERTRASIGPGLGPPSRPPSGTRFALHSNHSTLRPTAESDKVVPENGSLRTFYNIDVFSLCEGNQLWWNVWAGESVTEVMGIQSQVCCSMNGEDCAAPREFCMGRAPSGVDTSRMAGIQRSLGPQTLRAKWPSASRSCEGSGSPPAQTMHGALTEVGPARCCSGRDKWCASEAGSPPDAGSGDLQRFNGQHRLDWQYRCFFGEQHPSARGDDRRWSIRRLC